MATLIGKGALSVQASVRRKVLVRWLNIRGSVKVFAGVQKERNATALIDAKLFAGWGREVDSLSVEIVS